MSRLATCVLEDWRRKCSVDRSSIKPEDYSVGDLLRAAKYQLQNGNVRKTRESSLVQTKIDEALLWYTQCDFIMADE